jgi:thiamine-phosphate pyrophosphorylase
VALPVPVVINDRADVALACGAAGVHVGADDIPVTPLRRIVPPGFLIGASVGSESEAALAGDADYAGIGPVHGTVSKLDAGVAIGLSGFSRLATAAGLPAIAIGGMTIETAGQAIAAGAVGVAVIAAIFAGPDPEASARALREVIDRAWAARIAGGPVAEAAAPRPASES